MDFLTRPKRSTLFQLNESDLMCKNSCGFYGNPEWHGLCSRCFRDYQKTTESGPHHRTGAKAVATEKAASGHHHHRPPPSSSTVAKDVPPSTFDRFVSKKRQQSERKAHTMRSIFAASTTASKDIAGDHPKPARQVSADVQCVVREFNEFLQTLPKPVATDIVQRVQVVSNKLLEFSAADYSVDEMSKIANTFYEEFSERLNRHDLYAGLGEEASSKLMDYAESYILVRSYKYLFCPPTTDDEDKDLVMQNRVRKLNWVTALRLGAIVDEINPDVREAMDAAITDLIEVDTKKTVDAKLKSIVECCRHIAAMLQRSGNGPPSADQFLPAVIYLVLKANPPRMQSNIKFITRFANPNHLRTGEAGYFFTNLCCAVSFIESMDAKSLEMTEEEFLQYMSGDVSSPASLYDQQTFMCDGLRQMNKNLQLLHELQQRQNRLIENIKAEREGMDEFWESCFERARNLKEKFPLTIHPRKQLPVFEYGSANNTEQHAKALSDSITASPDPIPGTTTTAFSDPIPGTSTTASPDPIPGTTTTISSDPIPGTSTTASPDPIPGTTTTASPDPIPGTSTTVSSDPIPGTSNTVSPDPIPGTSTTVSSDPIPGTTTTASPDPIPGTSTTASPDPIPGTSSKEEMAVPEADPLIKF
ncbi:Rab5 GDP/GTP exchange factor [Hypsibius exemplaris]|uniref:Rab5 GDP/GTP exchange factor n=1 Tax=Hypsibius exemplaris TaxID=2072580 RepID=A0A1W0XCT0_HYPEX|nr:Rab5 GDP/GTP exchange factor [Hypsibius exemplaris]